MFEKLGDNLNLLMAQTRISASQLSKNTGLPATTIKRIRNNSHANPTLTSLLPIAQFFGITLSQLVGDEALPNHSIQGVFVNREQWTQVPIISWAQAIQWPKIDLSKMAWTSTDKSIGNNAYALEVKEETWANLPPGTILIIDPNIQPEHRDFAIITKADQKAATLKQVLVEDGDIYLKAMTPGYPITTFTDKYQFLGTVIEYKMTLRS